MTEEILINISPSPKKEVEREKESREKERERGSFRMPWHGGETVTGTTGGPLTAPFT